MISVLLYKVVRRIYLNIGAFFHNVFCHIIFLGNNVKYRNFNSSGFPVVIVSNGGIFTLGKNFSMHNQIEGNPIGFHNKCIFFVGRDAKLIIGDNVGISQSALVCHIGITIGDYVKIGGGVKIYDTDFHSLDAKIRATKEDTLYKAKSKVVIKSHAFIGASSIILKGVTVGENSIVGAGSVVTKSIPDNQIWAGNPAKFIREV